MNLLSILYVSISAQLKILVPELKWIDLWSRQTDFTETAEMIDFPAAFISFPNINFDDMGRKAQEANITVRIYVAYHNYQSTSINADNAERNEALKFLEYLQKISNGLHGFSSDSTGTLARINMVEHDSGTDVCVYYLEFATNLVDEGAFALQNPTTSIELPNAELVIEKDIPPPPPPTPQIVWFNFPK